MFSKRLSKTDVVSHYRMGSDTIRYGFDKPGIQAWTGQVLILSGERDAVSTESARKTMSVFYPCSQVYAIQGADHTPGMTQPDKYAEVINRFLMG